MSRPHHLGGRARPPGPWNRKPGMLFDRPGSSLWWIVTSDLPPWTGRPGQLVVYRVTAGHWHRVDDEPPPWRRT